MLTPKNENSAHLRRLESKFLPGYRPPKGNVPKATRLRWRAANRVQGENEHFRRNSSFRRQKCMLCYVVCLANALDKLCCEAYPISRSLVSQMIRRLTTPPTSIIVRRSVLGPVEVKYGRCRSVIHERKVVLLSRRQRSIYIAWLTATLQNLSPLFGNEDRLLLYEQWESGLCLLYRSQVSIRRVLAH